MAACIARMNARCDARLAAVVVVAIVWSLRAAVTGESSTSPVSTGAGSIGTLAALAAGAAGELAAGITGELAAGAAGAAGRSAAASCASAAAVRSSSASAAGAAGELVTGTLAALAALAAGELAAGTDKLSSSPVSNSGELDDSAPLRGVTARPSNAIPNNLKTGPNTRLTLYRLSSDLTIAATSSVRPSARTTTA
jgi:hypothetical protein